MLIGKVRSYESKSYTQNLEPNHLLLVIILLALTPIIVNSSLTERLTLVEVNLQYQKAFE